MFFKLYIIFIIIIIILFYKNDKIDEGLSYEIG